MPTLMRRFNDAQCELMRYGKIMESQREEIKALKRTHQIKYGKIIQSQREEFHALKRRNRELERIIADHTNQYEDKNMERNAQIDYMNVEFNRMEKLIKELREEIKNKKTQKVLRVKIKKLKKTDWEVKYAKLYETYMIEKYAHEEANKNK